MDQSQDLPFRASPPPGLFARSGKALVSMRGAYVTEVSHTLAENCEPIPGELCDVVVRRLFAAGMALQATLEMMGGHPATSKIHYAADELDQAITEIRDSIFNRDPPGAEQQSL